MPRLNPRTAEIVRSTVQLTHSLGLELVAEGVETEAARRLLVQMGCDTGQGHHLGQPFPAALVAPREPAESLAGCQTE